MGSVREAFGNMNSPKDVLSFVAVVFAALFGSCAILVLLAILNIIPIAMIAVGALHLHDCRINPMIPIWLIVSGSTSLVQSALSPIAKSEAASCFTILARALLGLLSLFHFVWLILGSVWVYGAYGKVSYEPVSVDYCDKATFLFPFIVLTIAYSLIALLCVTLCCLCCCACCIGK
ncbi:unnamed protein product [Cylicocyclus nassatus]|uniref:Uncharacterized protein n=1 Tax=Cylicocyclus nassatus TaxID=53992 RepID=A0AA36GWB7_CYLNA|nr:unnamed protein product [Cylicocyclus nassatus]